MRIGYALSSEEHSPLDLVAQAEAAEAAGFAFALISDHFHPWTVAQGESAFVWSVLGGIAARTSTLEIGTGVTCPLIRVHPAIVAQAAATAGAMLPGRFFLGVGTGENLNEHVLGARWPSAGTRLDMLEEAIAVIRELWRGELVSHRGDHYTVENARLFTLPDDPIEIMVAAAGTEAASLAARIGDGLVSTAPDKELPAAYAGAGGRGPRYGQLTVCWAPSREQAIGVALEQWPNAGLKGPLAQELPLPAHFEAASEMVSEADIVEAIVCGPDPELHLAGIRSFLDAGFDNVYVHQVGKEQNDFFGFYEREVIPALEHLESPVEA